MKAPFRYKRLAYVELAVTDLEASTRFYRDLVGLEQTRSSDGRLHLRCCESQQNIVLSQGDTPGVVRVAFELESLADIDKAMDYLTAEGFEPRRLDKSECDEMLLEAGLRFTEPTMGLGMEYHIALPAGEEPFKPTKAKIARLGHVVLNVEDFDKTLDVFVNKLNFVVSDKVEGRIAFTRCFPNPYHHSLALIAGPKNGLNHVNFMVSDIDDIGVGMNRMKKADVPIVFGPGRHLPSGSIFLYFLDPDKMTMEYSYGMEEFGEHDAREPRDLEPSPLTLDTWGSTPDPRFGKVGEIVHADD